MTNTSIQWADSTENPLMGCDGCPLYPSPATVRAKLLQFLHSHLIPTQAARRFLKHHLPDTLTALYQRRHELGERFVSEFRLVPREEAAFAKVIASQVRCYAATLHLMRGRNVNHPERPGHKGYAPIFEEVKLFPGRMARTARLKPLTGLARPEKPWLNGLPRLIFVSDMGDALSGSVAFEYLKAEIIDVVTSKEGSRHWWLWLTKRPARMAKFADWLAKHGIPWPKNLAAMTSVLDRKMASAAVAALRKVPAPVRGLSIEPLVEDVELDFTGIDWAIVGGESGHYARPFDLAWARSLRDQCRKAGVAFFMKQIGAKPVENGATLKLADAHGGDWSEWPEDLRVREMPRGFSRI
jgi:protein gp37